MSAIAYSAAFIVFQSLRSWRGSSRCRSPGPTGNSGSRPSSRCRALAGLAKFAAARLASLHQAKGKETKASLTIGGKPADRK